MPTFHAAVQASGLGSTVLRRARLGLATGLALTLVSGAALAQSFVPLPSNPTVVGGSATITSVGALKTVTPDTARTIIDWDSFNVNDGFAMDFMFGAGHNDWIVLNRTNGQAVINGALQGCLSNCLNDFGGNVWLYAGSGVFFGPKALVNTGGLLATTSPLSNTADFLDPTKTDFTFATPTEAGHTSVVTNGKINGHGGVIALIGQEVGQEGTVSDAEGTVLYGGAKAYTLHLAKSPSAGNWDMVDFFVKNVGDGSSSTLPIGIYGTTTAGNIYVAAVTQRDIGYALVKVNGDLEASSASISNGNIVLTAGGSIAGGVGVLDSEDYDNLSVGGLNGRNLTLHAMGTVSVVSDITATDGLLFNAAGAVNKAAPGVITTPHLTAYTGAHLALRGANRIGRADMIQASTTLIDNAQTLTLGTIMTTQLRATAETGNLMLDGDIVASNGLYPTNLVTLHANDGSIVQTGGIIRADNLQSLKASGSIDLQKDNIVTNFKSSAADTILFNNIKFMTASDLSASGIWLTTSDENMNLSGRIGGWDGTSATIVSVKALNGSIVQTGGTIAANSLRQVYASGSVTLGQANHVHELNDVTANSLVFNNDASLVVKAIKANSAVLTAAHGTIFLTRNMTARNGTSKSDSLTVTANDGDINQTGGVIKTHALAATASGNVTLLPGNDVGP